MIITGNKFYQCIKSKKSIFLNTDVIIKQDEILTAGIYENSIYDKFTEPKVESETPKRGKKPNG